MSRGAVSIHIRSFYHLLFSVQSSRSFCLCRSGYIRRPSHLLCWRCPANKYCRLTFHRMFRNTFGQIQMLRPRSRTCAPTIFCFDRPLQRAYGVLCHFRTATSILPQVCFTLVNSIRSAHSNIGPCISHPVSRCLAVNRQRGFFGPQN